MMNQWVLSSHLSVLQEVKTNFIVLWTLTCVPSAKKQVVAAAVSDHLGEKTTIIKKMKYLVIR